MYDNITHSKLLLVFVLLLYFAAIDRIRSEQFLGIDGSTKFVCLLSVDMFGPAPVIAGIAPRLVNPVGLKQPGGRVIGGVKPGCGGVPISDEGVLVLEGGDLGEVSGDGVDM